MDCQDCRNAILKKVALIRRSAQKILTAHGNQDRVPVTPALLNMQHDLCAIEEHIERCRKSDGNA